ncbi:hypothetical protein FRB94_011485 [Tulasnella sp. JGI-2019a]|nr:hypothetical protein FRB94_011485 [Tulasnella sp. JGI-2019a]KAG9003228.1 hypothetical protein FRB93_011140 [Tulasnella sp. JGI-2019a]
MSAPVVLITGCGSNGIGHNLCNEFSKKGYIVYATGLRFDLMTEVKDDTGNIRQKELDVCSDESTNRTVEEVMAEAGRLDIVIANAGILESGAVLDIPINRVNKVYDVNVNGTLRLARAAIPHMAARHQGLFVCIGSATGLVPTPWTGIYASSKAAVHHIAGSLQMECKPLGVNIMLVAPGGVRSGIATAALANFKVPDGSLYSEYSDAMIERMFSSQKKYAYPAAEFAKALVHDALKPTPPTFFSVGGGSWLFYFLAWLPKWMALAFLWRMFGKKNKPKA